MVLLAGMEVVFGQQVPHGQLEWSDYCATCHDCSTPTLEHPCLRACPRHAGHFRGEHPVEEGPKTVVLDQLVDLYEPVVFAHDLHASMATMSGGCALCHHFSRADAPVPPCRQCHAEEERLGDIRKPSLKGAYHRQCMNCHREWSHETDCGICHEVRKARAAEYTPGGRSDIIGIPHPRITAEPRYVYETAYETAPVVTFHHTNHVDQFGLTCASCHQGDNCGRCHDLGHHRIKIEHVKTCITCHREDNCEFCHSTVEKPPFDHAGIIGWSLEPYHVRARCEDCHGPTKQFVTPSPTCLECHSEWEAGEFDHAVTGLQLSEYHSEIYCLDCHVDPAFRKTPACDFCHDDIAYPDFLPGERVE